MMAWTSRSSVTSGKWCTIINSSRTIRVETKATNSQWWRRWTTKTTWWVAILTISSINSKTTLTTTISEAIQICRIRCKTRTWANNSGKATMTTSWIKIITWAAIKITATTANSSKCRTIISSRISSRTRTWTRWIKWITRCSSQWMTDRTITWTHSSSSSNSQRQQVNCRSRSSQLSRMRRKLRRRKSRQVQSNLPSSSNHLLPKPSSPQAQRLTCRQKQQLIQVTLNQPKTHQQQATLAISKKKKKAAKTTTRRPLRMSELPDL